MERYTLRLIFEMPFGKSHQMAIDVSPCVAHKIEKIPLPSPLFDDFNTAVKKLQYKELRRELFISECVRLGTKLADNMEDKEGWHGSRRQELTTNPNKSKMPNGEGEV